MITETDITDAFSKTTESARASIEACFVEFASEKENAVYSIIEQLNYSGSKFGTILIHSDGGIKKFFVTYKFGDYLLLVCVFCFMDTYPFNSVTEFCNWLNKEEKKILATSTLISLGD